MTNIVGRLEPFFETGTEGIVWSVVEDGKSGYDSLHPVKCGDHLTIFDKQDTSAVVWDGDIQFEYKTNYESYPLNPEYGQQAVKGLWVNGLQEGVDAEQWFTWFYEEYPATLIINEKTHNFPTREKP